MDEALLKSRILKKVELQVSDIESIEDIDSHIDTAISESKSIIKNKDLGEAYWIDIAYHRFLLLVSQVEITEEHTKIYNIALKEVKEALNIQEEAIEGEEPKSCYAMVGTRREFT